MIMKRIGFWTKIHQVHSIISHLLIINRELNVLRMCGDDLFPIYIWPHPGAPPLDQKPHQCPYFPHPLPQGGRVGHDIDRCIT